jgi:RNA polymerase sigma-70 factor, ECF subfamily
MPPAAGGCSGRLWQHDLLLRLLLLPARMLPVPLRLPPRRQPGRRDHRQMLLRTMNETPAMAADVWHALSGELRSFLRSRVPHDSDADDILQDVFVKIVEKIGSLRDATRLESWVYKIARNAITDFYRREAPQPADPVEDAVAPGEEQQANNLNRSIAAWLALALARLPDTVREAVRLYELEGVSQAEIADRLGVSLSGAKSRIQRGRRQLEGLLRGCCQLELDRRGNVIACQPAKPDGCAPSACTCDG